MQIKDQWNQLDPATRQWFLENPGCVILPRAVVAAVHASTHGQDREDRHGEVELSQQDREFILAKARGIG